MAQQVKNLPVMQETQEAQVPSLGGENPLERQTATHSSFLAWEILWTEEPGWLQSKGSSRVRHDQVTNHARVRAHTHTHTHTHTLTQL